MPISDLDETGQARVAAAIVEHFIDPAWSFSQAEIDNTVFIHAIHRVAEFRNNVLPWLRSFCKIGVGARVLEVGAGTGSSIVVLAETGATVDGVDIEDGALKVAALRLRLHGYDDARVFKCNAAKLDAEYAATVYDLIVFSAVLEHMTHEERLKSLRDAWANLRPGGVLCIYETPNRLWFHDSHTAQMNFYHWLPDALAMDYARYSPRPIFNRSFDALPDPVALARWGRGASFHEFEVAIGLAEMDLQTSLHEYLSAQYPHYRDERETSLGSRYAALLREMQPQFHHAFAEEMLSFAAIKRPELVPES